MIFGDFYNTLDSVTEEVLKNWLTKVIGILSDSLEILLKNHDNQHTLEVLRNMKMNLDNAKNLKSHTEEVSSMNSRLDKIVDKDIDEDNSNESSFCPEIVNQYDTIRLKEKLKKFYKLEDSLRKEILHLNMIRKKLNRAWCDDSNENGCGRWKNVRLKSNNEIDKNTSDSKLISMKNVNTNLIELVTESITPLKNEAYIVDSEPFHTIFKQGSILLDDYNNLKAKYERLRSNLKHEIKESDKDMKYMRSK